MEVVPGACLGLAEQVVTIGVNGVAGGAVLNDDLRMCIAFMFRSQFI